MFLFKWNSNKNKRQKKVTDSSKTRKITFDGDLLSYRVANLQRQGQRERQEDSFAIINALDVNEILNKGMLAVVADGMGGMKDGKIASEAAVAAFVQAFRNLDREKDIPEQLVNCVSSINHSIYERFQGESGSTVVLLMIFQGKAYWLSIGDSSIYLKRNEGIYKLNMDHTYQNQLYLEVLYKEDIDKVKIEQDRDAARLSEFLGNSRVDKMDYNQRPLILKKNDVLLLCSDGVSATLDEETIADVLALPVEQACEQLDKLIEGKAKAKQDNYTALIISCV